LSAISINKNYKNENYVEDGDACKSLPITALSTKENALSAIVTDKAVNEAEGARTLNLRIDSPIETKGIMQTVTYRKASGKPKTENSCTRQVSPSLETISYPNPLTCAISLDVEQMLY
jgi:hypothetical protein